MNVHILVWQGSDSEERQIQGEEISICKITFLLLRTAYLGIWKLALQQEICGIFQCR